MEQLTLQVEGMSCGHCVNAIESSVKELNGVEQVKRFPCSYVLMCIL